MSRKLSFVVSCLALAILWLVPPVAAQINYSEESATFLADLFATEKGGTAEDHLVYGWRLAESLSYLTDAEQMFVFGFTDLGELSAIPSGTMLPRPIRMVWGQKIGEDPEENSATETVIAAVTRPSPTAIPTFQVSNSNPILVASAAKSVAPASLIPVSGLPTSAATSPPVIVPAMKLQAPVIGTATDPNTGGIEVTIDNPNDPSISDVSWTVSADSWVPYDNPFLIPIGKLGTGLTLEARATARSGFEADFESSAAAAELISPPSNLNAHLGLNPINFDLLSPILTSAALIELDKVVHYLNSNPTVTITVEGHTQDSLPDEILLKLSELRAEAVAVYLESKGIDPMRFKTIGYGNTRPLTTDQTPEAQAINRRIEILVN